MNASWAESVTTLPLDDRLVALDERLRAITMLPEAERGSGLGEAYQVVSMIDLTRLTTEQRWRAACDGGTIARADGYTYR